MQPEKDETQQKVNWIEKRLKAIEGSSLINGMNAFELSLVMDVVIPYKLKMLDLFQVQWVNLSKGPHDDVLSKNGRAYWK